MALKAPLAHRIAAQRWAMTLVEPLVSPTKRHTIEVAFGHTALTHPEWWAVYVSGVLSDITQTLPVDDPLRDLELLPDGSADWPGPHPHKFGTWESVADVIEPSSDAPMLDPSFFALEDPLHPLGTGLIRRSLDGWASVRPAVDAMLGNDFLASGGSPGGSPDGSPETPFVGTRDAYAIVTAAIRFAVHRRRSYGLPNDDVWPVVSGFTWTWRAQWVLDGRDINEDQIALAIRQEQIQPKDPAQ